MGQHDAGQPLTGGEYVLTGGFWADVPDRCLADWNGDSLLNTGDFLAYLNDYNAVRSGVSPSYDDPDLAEPFGVVNTSDFVAYLNAYGSGCD